MLAILLAVAVLAVAGGAALKWFDASNAPLSLPPLAAPAPPVEVPTALPPASPPCVARPRPETGTVLGRADQGGEGELTVNNGTGEDAVVVLVDGLTGRRRYRMFVRNAGEVTLQGVREGSYKLRFQLGEQLNWHGGFCESVGSQEFDRALDFVVTDYGGGHFTVRTHSVTLHPVQGGNARAHAIPDSLVAPPGG